ncbi:ArsR/SmtB family transcription factor [Corynebacterium sanguinis]|uniref:ArsR/SmtB family transcription factor n=1 Tax=Corynebacterium sanguinis TaxID=2594913 RepID=UPI00223BAFDE|nr:winged helix-turn-helix domain-containing protein [Corynebacterium sanguinis]MCT1425702.1 winged helix-turn-helix domain-containing protein [Corynebacterium sanguinis]MCT1628482.1 winged helix-turn-helix domain-containing protein [Corynebacterium sanguinis]MCT1664212.1 winged helix-turn-helix domain-containing protein [Corynebacterium sanguinis]MDN8576961.1 winged helix-turn-helix domain-containing protein [Corynebacterium sanguinis]
METAITEHIADLERRVAALEARLEPENPQPAALALIDSLKANTDLVDGAVTFGGVVDTGGRHYEYEWTRPTHWVTDSEWEEEISRLSALANPLRGEIMRRLLTSPATVTELVEEHIASSPGTAYHHLSALQAAGWVTKHDGSFAIPPARVVPLMAIITACEAH